MKRHLGVFFYLRQRKDTPLRACYATSKMTTLSLLPQTTVEELLHQLPQATTVFIHYQTACVGCTLARFCTLDDVAKIYEIELPELFGALLQGVTKSKA